MRNVLQDEESVGLAVRSSAIFILYVRLDCDERVPSEYVFFRSYSKEPSIVLGM